MSGSAARAMRLITWGTVALVTPFVVLAALFAWLTVRGVPVLAPLTGLLASAWLSSLLMAWWAARREQSPPLDQEDDEVAVTVGAEEQPALWGLVREAADLAGVPAPDELRLTAVGTITAWPRHRLRLDVGVPVLYVLDAPEVGALMGRALADAASGWVDAAEPVDRFRAFVRVLGRRPVVGGLARAIHRRISAARTAGLLEGDDAAARVAGPAIAARALGRAHVTRMATTWWLDEFVGMELAGGRAPRPLMPGLESLLGDPGRRAAMDRALLDRLPTGDADVPGLAERVHSLSVGPDAAPDPVGAPAADLLQAPSDVLDRVADAALGTVGWDRTWSQALEEWAVRTSQSSAIILAGRSGAGLDPLGDLLDGIGEGQLHAWVREVVRDPAADTHELGAFLLTGLLTCALVAGGAGRASATWGGEIDVVTADGTRLEVPRAARLLVEEPGLVRELRTMIGDLGASPDFVPDPGDSGQAPSLVRFLRRSGARRIPGTGFPACDLPS